MSSEIQELVKAINEQTKAMNQLVQVVAALIHAVADQDDEQDPDSPSSTYLDGSPINRG